jgi:WD40 repeat protein
VPTFSPDGQRLVSVNWSDETVRICDVDPAHNPELRNLDAAPAGSAER